MINSRGWEVDRWPNPPKAGSGTWDDKDGQPAGIGGTFNGGWWPK